MDAMPVRLDGPLIDGSIAVLRLKKAGVGFVNIYRSGFVGIAHETRDAAQDGSIFSRSVAYRIKITCKPELATEEPT